jgi:hypothetical protein
VKEIKILQRYPEKSPCTAPNRSHRSSRHLPPPSHHSQCRRAAPANAKNGRAPGCPSCRAPAPCPDPDGAPSHRLPPDPDSVPSHRQALCQAPDPCPSRCCREDAAPTRPRAPPFAPYSWFLRPLQRGSGGREQQQETRMFFMSCSAIFC